jgi:NAD(P)-dependent dehydrogenase (short-subunit alcohol dehydrogenase family)
MVDGRFEDKVAVVTGAASGIGQAISGALAAEGATVVLADLDGPGATAAAGALGGRARGVALDVTRGDDVAALVAEVVDAEGRLDLLFNNAGIGAGGPVELLEIADWDRVLDVDYRSVVYGVAAAYPVMVAQGHGHLVNTASLAGLVPSPLLTPYAAVKHAVVGLSMSLRAEAAPHGVRVSVVCPGPVETPLLDSGGGVNVRKLLTNALGPPYPAASLAADVLDGVAENRAFIVAPETGRAAWAAYRSDPESFVGLLADQAVAGAQRRQERA